MSRRNRDEFVPTYTETDVGAVEPWTTALFDDDEDLHLPVTKWPVYNTEPGNAPLSPAGRDTHIQIVRSLFDAIGNKNTEAVELLIHQGFISPDCPDYRGTTPLLTAVEYGNGAMVCTLIHLGAQVDLYGTVLDTERRYLPGMLAPRTPLQLAAEKGNIALVKLLMEDFHADDSLITPDGELALRLAADNGHREIVEYLPLRRGGAWRRWKVHHELAWSRIKTAIGNVYSFFKFFLWYVPRGLVWDIPKHCIVLPLRKTIRWAWKNRMYFGPWCKKQAEKSKEEILKFPEHLKDAAKATWRGIRAVPKTIWWAIKAVPSAARITATWIWESLTTVAKKVGEVATRFLSLLHTVVAAVLGFFRSITLKDVWNGICHLFDAVFIDFPKAIWSAVKSFGDASYKALSALFGWVGQAIWWICRILLYIVQCVPEQLWEVVRWAGSTIIKGYHEIRVWINPKW